MEKFCLGGVVFLSAVLFASCAKTVSDADTELGQYLYKVQVTAASDAIPGEKFILFESEDGNKQAGSVGIQVIGATQPSFIPRDKNVAAQISTNFDFSSFNSAYWISGTPPGPGAGAKVINYKISSQLYDENTKALITTPTPILTKIHKSMALWGSVFDANISFNYSGTYTPTVGTGTTVDRDDVIAQGGTTTNPVLLINLTGSRDDLLPSGTAGMGGPIYQSGVTAVIPDAFIGGTVSFRTRLGGLYTLGFKTIIHEVGHALGLHHTATNVSIMSCGTPAWITDETLALSAQDRADLTRVWNSASTNLYTISGEITTSDEAKGNGLFVYAVNVENGNMFSDLTELGSGVFSINVNEPGEYKIMTKGYEFDDVGARGIPAWYRAGDSSASSPDNATSITLSSSNRNVTGVNFRLFAAQPPYTVFWTYPWSITRGGQDLEDDVARQTFISPGGTAAFVMMYLREKIATATPFGRNPGITFSNSMSY